MLGFRHSCKNKLAQYFLFDASLDNNEFLSQCLINSNSDLYKIVPVLRIAQIFLPFFLLMNTGD